MVGSAAGVHPTAAVRAWGQLSPVRRTEVAQDDCQIWASVKDMLVAGNTKVTDLLCVTPPWIPGSSPQTWEWGDLGDTPRALK